MMRRIRKRISMATMTGATSQVTAVTTAALLVGLMTEIGEANEVDPIHHEAVTCVAVTEMDLFLVVVVARGE